MIEETKRHTSRIAAGLRVILLATIVVAVGEAPCLADNIPQPGEAEGAKLEMQTSLSALDQRGKQLRAELQRVYGEMAADHTLQSGQNILNEKVITPYIPPGTSFVDAMLILRGAGFNCKTEELVPHKTGLNGWSVLDNTPFAKVEVGISAYPQIPNDMSSPIGTIGVALFVSNL